MAITKYKVIQKNLEAVINYAKNGEKTEHGILVSGINCLPENVYTEMMLVKKNFHKEDGRLGYHFIQSFKGKEVSAEECNDIGMELANSLWGDKYQVLVCTHIDKDNVHNHIILNSVSFIDGSKYHNSNVELALLREINDDLCIKYGLSVVETDKANREDEIAESRIANYNRNSGKMELIKKDIDEAIENAVKYQDFIDELGYKGYFVKKYNNSISISTPYFNRNIRIARAFGEDYTFENIKHRIYYNDYRFKNDSNKIYKVGTYKQFKIYEPKERIIEALPYKDRVVLMALCSNIIEPKFERRLIYDNVACRKGKGTDFGIKRLEKFLHSYYKKFKTNQGYVLKCDVRKYFQNIDHTILFNKLKKEKFDEDEIWILKLIIDSKNQENGVGLPIGNQTSQWFGLYYLDEIDRLIKEKLRIKYYVRYMDDMILLHNDKEYLKYCKEKIEKYTIFIFFIV